MKRILFFAGALITASLNAQTIDSVSLGSGYANTSFYSFENGEVSNVDNNDWDLGFDLSSFGATIKLNWRTNAMWVYPGSTADYTSLDTAGHSAWDQFTDGDDSWSEGALNGPADAGNPEDLGWGDYNSVTHFIEGSRLFVIELQSGDYIKLFVEELASGIYTFKYSDLANTNEVNETITKGDYPNKNFIYYDLDNEQVIDREPNTEEWDIVFTNYVRELAPGYFGGLTGALHNYDILTSEVSGVPSADATWNSFDASISTIGYDWKTFNMGTFAYDIEDSLTYFVQVLNGDVWKLVFTGFGGSADGKIYFTKEKVAAAGIENETTQELSIFPNPAINQVTINAGEAPINSVQIFDMTGQLVYVENNLNLNSVIVPVDQLNNGSYIIYVTDTDHSQYSQKLMVNH